MEYDYIMWFKVYIDIYIYIYLKYMHDNMAAPPGVSEPIPHDTCFMSRTDCFTCQSGRRRLRTTIVSSWVGQGWRPMGTRIDEVQDRWQTSVLASERIWLYDKKMWVQHNAALLWTNTFSLHKQIFSVRKKPGGTRYLCMTIHFNYICN